MDKKCDVLIIGGGVTGAAIARELSRYRLSTVLLEKEAELAFGVSKSNSGIVHPGTQNRPGSLKGALCVQGNRLMRRIAKELGVHFLEVGELIVIFDEKDREALRRLQSEGEQLGVPGLKIVDRGWLLEHEPNIGPDVVAALYAPTAGIISPYRLTYDLAENAQDNGVEILTEQKVIEIERTGAHGAMPRFIVRTEQGLSVSAVTVINAAGLFADDIARMVGINDIVIKPRKGEEYLLDKKREHIVNHILFPLPTKASKGVLVIKTSDGNPMIGPTAEDIEDKQDLATTEAGLQKVLTSVKRMLPTVAERDIIAYFAGLRPVAGEDFIIRHEPSVPGMVTVAGIQSPGLTAAPAIACMVAGLVRGSGVSLRRKLFFKRKRNPTTHLFAVPLALTKRLMRKDKAYGDIVCRCEMVSAREVRDAIKRGARTLDGIKFRTRAQAGRCHGGFCTTRIMKIMREELGLPMSSITKRGKGSEIVMEERGGI